jgi:Domain of unknown function (DUF4932)
VPYPALLVSLALAFAAQPKESVAVSVDPRLELLSIVFRLAGNPEFNHPISNSPYSRAAAAHFRAFRGHAAIERAKALRADHGVSYDAVASLAMHVKDLPNFAFDANDASYLARLDARWTVERAAEFLGLVRQFRDESKFNEFFAANAELYATVESRMRDLLDRKLKLEWFANFFGTTTESTFALHPGLLLGGNNFGVGVRHADGREEITPCIGCWEFDDEGVPTFPDEVLPTVVHEFCHSYVNPIVDAHYAALAAPGEVIFPRVRSLMQRQAYTNWRIVLYESLVRASVVRYLAAHESAEIVAAEIEAQNPIGFTWTGRLAELLGQFEKDRAAYPTLADFIPRIAEFFAAEAQRAPENAETPVDPAAPRVVKSTPANGDQAVDPALAMIEIHFDRAMNGNLAVMTTGGPDHFPAVQKTKDLGFDASATILRLPVELEPGRDYEFGLNSATNRKMASKDGVPLPPIVIKFRTAPD